MKHFDNRSQDQRLSMGEQLARQLRDDEDEVDFSVIFSPPPKKQETD